MTPERWRQIEGLYHAALEHAPADRAALLAGADPELRHKVEAMLAQEASGKILDRPAKDLLTDSMWTTVPAGSHLGMKLRTGLPGPATYYGQRLRRIAEATKTVAPPTHASSMLLSASGQSTFRCYFI